MPKPLPPLDTLRPPLHRQFDYALRRKGVKKMIAVVMEKARRNPREWTGAVGGKLGGLLYVDLADDAKFDDGLRHLITEIQKVTAAESVARAAALPPTSTAQAVAAAPGAVDASMVDVEVSHGHTAPRKLSSDPEVLKAREQAVSLGLAALLEQTGVVASTTQLAAGARFCAEEGARSVEEVARYGKANGLIAALELKAIPQEKVREALAAMAPASQTPGRAQPGGCCIVA